MEQKSVIDNEILVENYDVANTLFILSGSLGENYISKGESPFDCNFTISEKLIKKVLENKQSKDKVVAPLFLENSNTEIKTLFNNSMEENAEIVDMLTQMLYQGDFDNNPQEKEEVSEIITLLKARKTLLKLDIEKLENPLENPFDLYVELVNLGKRIEEIMEDSYTKRLEKEIIIQSLIEYARGLAKINTIKNNQINAQQNKIKKQFNLENSQKNIEIIKENNKNNEIYENNEFLQ